MIPWYQQTIVNKFEIMIQYYNIRESGNTESDRYYINVAVTFQSKELQKA